MGREKKKEPETGKGPTGPEEPNTTYNYLSHYPKNMVVRNPPSKVDKNAYRWSLTTIDQLAIVILKIDLEKQGVMKLILDDMKATNKVDSTSNTSTPRKSSADSSPMKLSSPSKSSITSEDLKSILRSTDSPDMNTYTPLLDQYIKQILLVLQH